MRARLEKIGEGSQVGVLLLGTYILLVPSISLIPSLEPYNEKRVLQIGVLLIGAGILVISGTTRRRWLSVFRGLPALAQWGFGAVVGLGVLSSVLAPAPFYAVLEVGHFVLLFALAGIVASAVRREPKRTEWLILGAVALSALLYAVYFAVFYGMSVTLPALGIGRETVSGFANTRLFNQYQTWTLPLLIGAVFALPKRWRASRGIVFFLAALWWTLVFASNVRGTVVAMGVAAVTVGVFFQRASYRWLGGQAAALLAGGALYFVVFYLPGETVPQFADRLRNVGGEAWRIQRWLSCVELTQIHPWLGVGPMHFAWPPFHFEPGAHPHNAFLQWMVEWGIPSTAIMSGLVVWGGWRWMQQEKKEAQEESASANAVRVGLVAAAWAGAAHAMVSGIIVMPVSQILLVLIGGWAWGRYSTGGQSHTASSWTAHTVLCVLLAASVAVVGGSLHDLSAAEERQSTYAEVTEKNAFWPRYWQQGYIGVRKSSVIEQARRDR